MKNHNLVIANTIRTLRKENSLSQKELANLAGISQGQLSKIERGEHSPSIENLDMLATALEIPVSFIAYMVFDRDKVIQDNFTKKMFDTYDLLINTWLFMRKVKESNTTFSSKKENTTHSSSKKYLQELDLLVEKGIKVETYDFIKAKLS